MKGKKLNLEEILKSHSNICCDDWEDVIIAMKEACRQTLELAAENADLIYCENECDIPENVVSTGDSEYGSYYISKKSITDTINQVQ